MEQNQQWLGAERRQSQTQSQYQGDERRKPEPIEKPVGDPDNGKAGMKAAKAVDTSDTG